MRPAHLFSLRQFPLNVLKFICVYFKYACLSPARHRGNWVRNLIGLWLVKITEDNYLLGNRLLGGQPLSEPEGSGIRAVRPPSLLLWHFPSFCKLLPLLADRASSTIDRTWPHTTPVLIGLTKNDSKYRITSQRERKEHRLCNLKETWRCTLNLGNSLSFSESQCFHLSNGSNSTNNSNWHQFPVYQVDVIVIWENLYKWCSTWHIVGSLETLLL